MDITHTKVFLGRADTYPADESLGPHMGTCHSKSVSRRHLTISWDPDRDQWQLYVDSKTAWWWTPSSGKRVKRSTFFTSRPSSSGPCACYFVLPGGEGEPVVAASTVAAPAPPPPPPPPVAVPPPLVRPAAARADVRRRVEIKLRRVRPKSSRRPPRHRRDACSMAWRCRFLTAKPEGRSRRGRNDWILSLGAGVGGRHTVQSGGETKLLAGGIQAELVVAFARGSAGPRARAGRTGAAILGSVAPESASAADSRSKEAGRRRHPGRAE